MNHTLYELIWYFFIYSFLGWVLEIIYAAVKKKSFLNRGVLNGPQCPVYGLGMVLSIIFFDSLKDNFIFLAIGCGLLATILEFFTGSFMKLLFAKRWWDYSDYPYNIGGYVCLPFSMLWGLLAALMIAFGQPLMSFLIHLLPVFIGRILLIVLGVLFILDLLSVLGVAVHVHQQHKPLSDLAGDMQQFSNRLGRIIFGRIERRMIKAHPALVLPADKTDTPAVKTGTFAAGCSFYKLFWLFMISAFLGDIVETIFCLITSGVLMSRSSVVYGPFSIVWGLGVVVLSVMLHRYQDRDDRYIFLFGTAMGGVYEYICSVFTELVFGAVFWDYSGIPFNLGGRINLLYCFFWGFAAVIWIKLIYPRLSRLIEKIPPRPGTILTWCMFAFMTVNIVTSSLALARYAGRTASQPPANSLETYLDTRFPDTRMQQIYPKAKMR